MNDDEEMADEEVPDEDYLGFYMEDREFVRQLARAVRKLIEREDMQPEQIYHLAKLLVALERFPRPTKGLALEVALGITHKNGEKSYQDLYVDESSFRVGNGAWIIIDPSVGGDSRSDTILEVEVGGYRELMHPTAFADWVEAFAVRVTDLEQELEISDSEDGSKIDWDAEVDERDWEKLGSDYV